jgi:hypothetical protein
MTHPATVQDSPAENLTRLATVIDGLPTSAEGKRGTTAYCCRGSQDCSWWGECAGPVRPLKTFIISRSLYHPCNRREIDPGSSPEQRQAVLLQHQLSPHELAHQESLIQERELEIREIESGIHELAEIFHDLGTLVDQQGGMLGMSANFVPSLS